MYVAPDNRTFLKFFVHVNRRHRVYNFTQNWTDYWKFVREYGLEKEVRDTINEVKNSKVNYDLIEKMLQERNITFKRNEDYYIAEFNITYSEVLRALNETNPIVEFFNADQDFKKLGLEVNYTDEGGYMRVKVNKNGFPTEVYWVTGMRITLTYPKKNQKVTFFLKDTLLLKITNINRVKVEPPKDLIPLLNNSTSS
ncbi:MAG: hypothetical protein H0Z18_08970 [Thermococcus sp.]|uniref:hypothetical protein n=1 Tax=Thermococcus sp. TaxID=35749 RepID=UPI001D48CA6C|nr:hypothetical protein [Thermococcus sp.]MBO8175374.1 hypothetical protein [Thermococcus sp.]